MANNETLDVAWEAKGAYPVKFVEGLFGEADAATIATLRAVTDAEKPRLLLVADANVVQRTEGLGTRIGKYVQAHGLALAAPPVVLAGGEKVKADAMQSAVKIITAALDAKIGRHDAVVAIGGGTILDVAGYAAAQVRGGVALVRVPTTVAAMVDATFAPTACLDSLNVKDALRVPCRPAAVLIDTAFAGTVLDGVWRGGVSEIVRHAAANDATLMKRVAKVASDLRGRDTALMDELIRATVASRATRGGSDFALWSAARLEAMSGYKLPHGYAVAIGICIDCAYAVERGLLSDTDQETICRALADCGALDGLAHSHHLIAQTDSVLKGLDAWRLATGSEARPLAVGLGKAKTEKEASRAAYRKVIQEFIAASAGESDDDEA